MSTLTPARPATTVAARRAGVPELPQSHAAPSLRLERASFPVEITFLAHDVWAVTEVIGSSRVLHGHLRRQHGRYTISTAGGTRSPERDWQALLSRHLGTR